MAARVLVSSLTIAGAASIVACSSTTVNTPTEQGTDAASEEPPVAEIAQPDGSAEQCTLDESQSTGRKTCDDCLLASCCVVITTCFSDASCTEMNACMNDCGQKYGRTDEGSACVRECASKDAKAAEKLLDMLDCESDRCGTKCKS
jgi:hypothetical protein